MLPVCYRNLVRLRKSFTDLANNNIVIEVG